MKTRWIGLIACLVFGPAQAASFDCHKAQTEVEKLICTDAELSAQDEALARAYKDAAKRTAEPDRYKREQRTWNKAREECLGESDKAACLKDKYTRRVQALSGNCWRHKPWWFGKSQVSGANWPMCKIMLENLNRFCHEEPQAKLDPGITSLKTINWQPIDPRPHLEWIKESIRWRGYRSGTRQQPDDLTWDTVRPEIERRLRSGQLTIREAKFDLTNDGVPELVRRGNYGGDLKAGEPMHSFGGGTGYVITDEGTDLPIIERSSSSATWVFFGHVVFNAGKTYLLSLPFVSPGQATEMELAEPFTVFKNAPLDKREFGENTVCMFERINN